MVKRVYRWKWTAAIDPQSLPLLQGLAKGLGFTVKRHGGFQGDPSPAAMLDALAAAYERDPGGVHLALKVIGVYNKPDAPEPFDLSD